MKKCRNCGAEYPGDDARFCENCGSPLETVEENEQQQEPTPSADEITAEETQEGAAETKGTAAKQPKMDSVKIPKPDLSKLPVDNVLNFVKNPKHLTYIVGGVAAVALIAVAANFMGCGKTKINLNDYLSVDYNGYDSVGTAECYFDAYGVYEDNSKAFRPKSRKSRKSEEFYDVWENDSSYVTEVLKSAARPELEKREDLSNGDKITCEWRINEDMLEGLEDTYGVIFKYKDSKEKVEDLKEVEEYDIFEQLNVSYDGYDGSGYVTAVGTERFYGLEYPWTEQDTKNGKLSNGDKLTFNIVAPGDYDNDIEKYIITNYGVKPETLEKEYTVSGLGEMEEFDPFERLDVRFTGRSPFVNMELVNNNEIYGIEFVAERTEGLAEGDEIVVTAQGTDGELLEDICASQGKKLVAEKKTYTVENVDAYVEKLEDIPQETMDKMDRAARKPWNYSYFTVTNMEFLGNYFLKAKEGSGADPYTKTYFVYRLTLEKNETKESFTMYEYMRFDNIIRLKDGTCTLDFQSAQYPGNGDSTDIDRLGYWFDGYPEIDSMFYNIVTQNSDYYDYESTVTE